MQFIPARGRKLSRAPFRACSGKLQFIPARGRKPRVAVLVGFLMMRVAIHPREGTETRFQI